MENNDSNPNSGAESTQGSSSPSLTPPANADGSPLSFGDWLKFQRTQRKISLEEVAAVTKVHIQQLKSLEENDVSKLPAPAFVRGFLVSYSRHLGLDENEVLDHYKSSFGGSLTPISDLLSPTKGSARSASAPKVAMVSSPQIKEAPSTRTVEAEKRPAVSMKTIGILVGVIAIAGLIGTLMTIGKKSKNAPTETPVVESSSETASSPSAAATDPNATPSSAGPINTAGTASTSAAPGSATTNQPTSAAPKAENPPPAAATKTTTPTTTAVTPPSTNEAPSTEAPKKFQLEFKALEGNYVHLRIDDGSAKGITLKAGQTHLAGANRKAVLTISDAGNVEIRWNGTWYAAPGFRGDLKVLTLPDQLSQLTPKAAAPRPRPKAAAPAEGTAPAAPPAPAPAGGPED